MHNPRVLFAAPASGSGKTVITCGILTALVRRGKKVSSFKCGPDYIDPMFHEQVIGTRSGNLDLFFSDPSTLRRNFLLESKGADISVIEGVMGYYDGPFSASERASSYDISRTLEAPTVLIVNARGQILSALATLEGFLAFRPDSRIGGVVFNQMTEHVYTDLKDAVRQLGVEPLGFVPKSEDLTIGRRHLGLLLPNEIKDMKERLSRSADLLEKTVDIDGIVQLAENASKMEMSFQTSRKKKRDVPIAIAKDEAFCFLYRDNLRLLEDFGANLQFFSPLHDSHLPKACGLLLPGGYPELYAEPLSKNMDMRNGISSVLTAGMPCLAECGGFLYLHRTVEDMHGIHWPMAGVIDAAALRSQKMSRFGYITLSPHEDLNLLRSGESIRGHEYHYYESENCGQDMRAIKPSGDRAWTCMHAHGNLLAGFPHLYYPSAPQLIERFLDICAGWRKGK